MSIDFLGIYWQAFRGSTGFKCMMRVGAECELLRLGLILAMSVFAHVCALSFALLHARSFSVQHTPLTGQDHCIMPLVAEGQVTP